MSTGPNTTPAAGGIFAPLRLPMFRAVWAANLVG